MFQKLAMDTFNNSVSVAAIELSGVGNLIRTGESEMGNAVKYGLSMAAAEDVVSGVTQGQQNSKLLTGHYLQFVDDVVYNGLAYYALERSMATRYVSDLVYSVSPVNSELVNDALVTGVLLSATRTIAETLDQMPAFANSPLGLITHATRNFQ